MISHRPTGVMTVLRLTIKVSPTITVSPKQLEYSSLLLEYEYEYSSQPIKSNHTQNTQTLGPLSPSEIDPHTPINILLATNKRKVNFLWPYF